MNASESKPAGSAAIAGFMAKPKAVAGSPALQRRQSHVALRPRREKHSVEGSPRARHKKDADLPAVVREIAAFHAASAGEFNPKYNEFEKTMTELLDRFQTQIEQLEAARASAEQMIEGFKAQVGQTHESYDAELAQLRVWLAPTEKVEAMQARVAELREVLAESKQKLATLDGSLSLAEEQAQLQDAQQRKVDGWVVLGALGVVLVAYWWWSH